MLFLCLFCVLWFYCCDRAHAGVFTGLKRVGHLNYMLSPEIEASFQESFFFKLRHSRNVFFMELKNSGSKNELQTLKFKQIFETNWVQNLNFINQMYVGVQNLISSNFKGSNGWSSWIFTIKFKKSNSRKNLWQLCQTNPNVARQFNGSARDKKSPLLNWSI